MPHDIDRHFPAPREYRSNPLPLVRPLGEAAQITLRGLTNELPELTRVHTTYPACRPRPRGAAPSTSEKYERYEELTALAGTGAAFVEIGTFSGYPDAIDLVATGGDALVSLRDATGREESSLRLIVNVPRDTHISRRKVFATNVSDASPATVRATGKWAEPYNGGAA